jgi:hypothetical protein
VSVNLQLVSTCRCQTIVTHFGVRGANLEPFRAEPSSNLFARHFDVWLKKRGVPLILDIHCILVDF